MKVLVVDDEPIVRRALCRAFSGSENEVKEAKDGIEGLKIYSEFEPDLVFLDVLMPGLTGPELIKELGEKRRAKIILMSAYTGEYNVEKAKSIGADLFFPKPFDDIMDVVNTAKRIMME